MVRGKQRIGEDFDELIKQIQKALYDRRKPSYPKVTNDLARFLRDNNLDVEYLKRRRK